MLQHTMKLSGSIPAGNAPLSVLPFALIIQVPYVRVTSSKKETLLQLIALKPNCRCRRSGLLRDSRVAGSNPAGNLYRSSTEEHGIYVPFSPFTRTTIKQVS